MHYRLDGPKRAKKRHSLNPHVQPKTRGVCLVVARGFIWAPARLCCVRGSVLYQSGCLNQRNLCTSSVGRFLRQRRRRSSRDGTRSLCLTCVNAVGSIIDQDVQHPFVDNWNNLYFQPCTCCCILEDIVNGLKFAGTCCSSAFFPNFTHKTVCGIAYFKSNN